MLSVMQNNNSVNIYDVGEPNRILNINYIENQGLIWTLNTDSPYKMFYVSRDNIDIFLSFHALYNTIVSGNPYNLDFSEYDRCNFKKIDEYYLKLYKDGKITWFSDDEKIYYANFLNIVNSNQEYVLYFGKNPHIMSDLKSISVNIAFENSNYGEFYIPFMRHYENILKLTK